MAEQIAIPAAQSGPGLKPMRVGTNNTYQNLDSQVIDYQLWNLHTTSARYVLRGPRPKTLASQQYIASLGPAFTFGRFVDQPYPALLGKALNMASLNLGIGGIGPSFHTNPRYDALLSLVNRAKLATILIFSGRSQSTSRFKVHECFQEQYYYEGTRMPADYVYQKLLETESPEVVAAQVAEIRERYVAEFVQLLNSIQVPKVLLWVSKRRPDYQESYDGLHKLLSNFPHLVNQPMVDKLRSHCDAYLEYCDTPGLPQMLRHRVTGEPIAITRDRHYAKGKIHLTPSQLTHNHYYPSPDMHHEIAQQLVSICETLM